MYQDIVPTKMTFKVAVSSRPVNYRRNFITNSENKALFKNVPTPASFYLFSFFSNRTLQKNCRLQRDSNSDRWIEGEYADHLTTTTATKINHLTMKKLHPFYLTNHKLFTTDFSYIVKCPQNG